MKKECHRIRIDLKTQQFLLAAATFFAILALAHKPGFPDNDASGLGGMSPTWPRADQMSVTTAPEGECEVEPGVGSANLRRVLASCPHGVHVKCIAGCIESPVSSTKWKIEEPTE